MVDFHYYSYWRFGSHSKPPGMSNGLIFHLQYWARAKGNPLTLEDLDHEFRFCLLLLSKATAESLQTGLYKSSFSRFHTNSNELFSFVKDFWVIFSKGGERKYNQKRELFLFYKREQIYTSHPLSCHLPDHSIVKSPQAEMATNINEILCSLYH